MAYKYLLKYLKDRSFVKIKGNNEVKCEGRIRLSKIKLTGKNNILIIEKGARINKGNFSIKGDNNIIKIGKNCDLNFLKILMENKNSLIEIGEETTCEGTFIVSLEEFDIKIGKNCMISYDVEIRNTDSHKIFDMESNKRINIGKEVIIEDNVWIAAKTTVLKGSYIGRGSVIGVGSVVNKKINNNIIAGGVPAKELKKNIYWNRNSVIEK